MSLYNLVRGGFNPYALLCIAMAGIKNSAIIPRFRDAWLHDDGKEFTILTRTGGGNRLDFDAGNAMLKGLLGFVSDHDDTFDSTFAHFIYRVPEPYLADAEICAKFQIRIGDGETWQGVKPALDIISGERTRPKPEILEDDPFTIEACQAYNRMVALARASAGL